MKKRLGIISFFVIIFIAFIIVWNYSYEQGLEDAYIPMIEKPKGNFIPSESVVFKRFNSDKVDYANMPIDENYQRMLVNYYTNRAYPGAPPSIPHPIKNERSVGGNTCNKCHENGGFVEKFDTYAPVTPHAEKSNCRQCHVTKNTNETFKAFAFDKKQAPKVGKGTNNALLGSPPMIPHQLQLRENCIACHAGPSAPKEIRVSHPQRTNCRQCHLPKNNTSTQQIDASKFIRKFDDLNER